MAHYYEITFYGGDKATEESLRIWGESGLTWYLASREPLTMKQALDKCLAEHQTHSMYPDLVAAIPYCDGIWEVSAEEFEEGCGASRFEEDQPSH